MKKIKFLGIFLISIGLWVLFYKNSGFYGWGGYVDNSFENIIISSFLIGIGLILIKRRK